MIALILIVLLVVTGFIAIEISKSKTNSILDDYSNIYTNEKYKDKYLIENINVFKQDVSCGYAVIEMFAKWNKDSNITEKYLYDKYGKVVTSTGKSFE